MSPSPSPPPLSIPIIPDDSFFDFIPSDDEVKENFHYYSFLSSFIAFFVIFCVTFLSSFYIFRWIQSNGWEKEREEKIIQEKRREKEREKERERERQQNQKHCNHHINEINKNPTEISLHPSVGVPSFSSPFDINISSIPIQSLSDHHNDNDDTHDVDDNDNDNDNILSATLSLLSPSSSSPLNPNIVDEMRFKWAEMKFKEREKEKQTENFDEEKIIDINEDIKKNNGDISSILNTFFAPPPLSPDDSPSLSVSSPPSPISPMSISSSRNNHNDNDDLHNDYDEKENVFFPSNEKSSSSSSSSLSSWSPRILFSKSPSISLSLSSFNLLGNANSTKSSPSISPSLKPSISPSLSLPLLSPLSPSLSPSSPSPSFFSGLRQRLTSSAARGKDKGKVMDTDEKEMENEKEKSFALRLIDSTPFSSMIKSYQKGNIQHDANVNTNNNKSNSKLHQRANSSFSLPSSVPFLSHSSSVPFPSSSSTSASTSSLPLSPSTRFSVFSFIKSFGNSKSPSHKFPSSPSPSPASLALSAPPRHHRTYSHSSQITRSASSLPISSSSASSHGVERLRRKSSLIYSFLETMSLTSSANGNGVNYINPQKEEKSPIPYNGTVISNNNNNQNSERILRKSSFLSSVTPLFHSISSSLPSPSHLGKFSSLLKSTSQSSVKKIPHIRTESNSSSLLSSLPSFSSISSVSLSSSSSSSSPSPSPSSPPPLLPSLELSRDFLFEFLLENHFGWLPFLGSIFIFTVSLCWIYIFYITLLHELVLHPTVAAGNDTHWIISSWINKQFIDSLWEFYMLISCFSLFVVAPFSYLYYEAEGDSSLTSSPWSSSFLFSTPTLAFSSSSPPKDFMLTPNGYFLSPHLPPPSLMNWIFSSTESLFHYGEIQFSSYGKSSTSSSVNNINDHHSDSSMSTSSLSIGDLNDKNIRSLSLYELYDMEAKRRKDSRSMDRTDSISGDIESEMSHYHHHDNNYDIKTPPLSSEMQNESKSNSVGIIEDNKNQIADVEEKKEKHQEKEENKEEKGRELKEEKEEGKATEKVQKDEILSSEKEDHTISPLQSDEKSLSLPTSSPFSSDSLVVPSLPSLLPLPPHPLDNVSLPPLWEPNISIPSYLNYVRERDWEREMEREKSAMEMKKSELLASSSSAASSSSSLSAWSSVSSLLSSPSSSTQSDPTPPPVSPPSPSLSSSPLPYPPHFPSFFPRLTETLFNFALIAVAFYGLLILLRMFVDAMVTILFHPNGAPAAFSINRHHSHNPFLTKFSLSSSPYGIDEDRRENSPTDIFISILISILRFFVGDDVIDFIYHYLISLPYFLLTVHHLPGVMCCLLYSHLGMKRILLKNFQKMRMGSDDNEEKEEGEREGEEVEVDHEGERKEERNNQMEREVEQMGEKHDDEGEEVDKQNDIHLREMEEKDISSLSSLLNRPSSLSPLSPTHLSSYLKRIDLLFAVLQRRIDSHFRSKSLHSLSTSPFAPLDHLEKEKRFFHREKKRVEKEIRKRNAISHELKTLPSSSTSRRSRCCGFQCPELKFSTSPLSLFFSSVRSFVRSFFFSLLTVLSLFLTIHLLIRVIQHEKSLLVKTFEFYERKEESYGTANISHSSSSSYSSSPPFSFHWGFLIQWILWMVKKMLKFIGITFAAIFESVGIPLLEAIPSPPLASPSGTSHSLFVGLHREDSSSLSVKILRVFYYALMGHNAFKHPLLSVLFDFVVVSYFMISILMGLWKSKALQRMRMAIIKMMRKKRKSSHLSTPLSSLSSSSLSSSPSLSWFASFSSAQTLLIFSSVLLLLCSSFPISCWMLGLSSFHLPLFHMSDNELFPPIHSSSSPSFYRELKLLLLHSYNLSFVFLSFLYSLQLVIDIIKFILYKIFSFISKIFIYLFPNSPRTFRKYKEKILSSPMVRNIIQGYQTTREKIFYILSAEFFLVSFHLGWKIIKREGRKLGIFLWRKLMMEVGVGDKDKQNEEKMKQRKSKEKRPKDNGEGEGEKEKEKEMDSHTMKTENAKKISSSFAFSSSDIPSSSSSLSPLPSQEENEKINSDPHPRDQLRNES